MKKVGIALLVSLATLTSGVTTAFAATTQENVVPPKPAQYPSGETGTSSSTNSFAGFAVFDSQGNMISDIWGLQLSTNALDRRKALSNITQHYDLFSADKGVSLFVKAVNANGDPIPSPISSTLSIRTTSGWNAMTYDGQLTGKMKIEQGSLGVPFEYTDKNSTALYGNIDIVIGNPVLPFGIFPIGGDFPPPPPLS